MKKLNFKIIIPVIIAIVVMVVFGVIIGKQQKDINIIKDKLGLSEEKKPETKLTQKEFSKYIEEIPVTTENWKDYVSIETKTEERKDAFGEITDYDTEQYIKIKGDNIYGYLMLEVNYIGYDDENHSEIIHSSSGAGNELDLIYSINDKIYTLDDFQCTRLKGSLYTIDLPDDIWKNNNEILLETSEEYRKNVNGINEKIRITKDNYIAELGDMVSYENGRY